MPSIADPENYNGTPLQEKTTMSENNTPTPTSLDMSRINRLRDSERRKKVEHERNEKLILQMSSYEGMNKLAQLEGELTSKLNNGSSNNSNLNGIDNPSFSNDTATKNSNPLHKSNSLDNHSTASISASHPHANLQTLPPLASLDEAINALDTAAELLNEEEDISAELSALRSVLNRDEFTQSLNLYNTTVSNWTSPLGVVTSPHDEGKENSSISKNREIFSNGINRHTSFKQYVEPLTSATDRLVNEVRNNLSIVYQSEAQQLLSLLYSPHLQVLFPTHDEVALMREGDLNENQIVDISRNQYNSNNTPLSASNNDNIQEIRNQNFSNNSNFNSNNNPISRSRNTTMGDASDLQVVRISKTVDALGATIKNEGDAIVISRIITGGLIDKTGQLGEGDEIIKVNGTPVRGRNVDNVSNLIACATGDIELVIRPSKSKQGQRDANGQVASGMSHVDKEAQALHVRALFEYRKFKKKENF